MPACAGRWRQKRRHFLASRKQNRKVAAYDQSKLLRLARLQSLTEQIEKPAQSAEFEIWRELLPK